MGLFSIFTNQLIDVIEWKDDSRDTMVYRYDRNGKVVKNVTSDDKGDVEDPDNNPGGGGSDNTPGGGNTEGGGTTGGNEGDGLE